MRPTWLVSCVAGTVAVNGCQKTQSFTVTAKDSCDNQTSCTVTYTWTEDGVGPVIGGCPAAAIDLGCNPTVPTCADAQALPAAGVSFIRRFNVPSTPAIGSASRKTWAQGCRLMCRSRATVALGVVRLSRDKPDPSSKNVSPF